MSSDSVGTIKITQVLSRHGRRKSHQACLLGLGVRRIHRQYTVRDTVENRGMIKKIAYLLRIEES